MLTRSKFKLLCMKALQNDISECELETLNKWMKKSSANKAEFDQMKKIWDTMGSIQVNPPAMDLKKEWESVAQKINAVQENSQNKSSILNKLTDTFINQITIRKYINARSAYSIAAVIIMIVFSILIYQKTSEKDIHFQTFAAANKQKVNVQLSDGSSIKLNSGSSIIVQDEFDDDKREVKLSGEAYFDVAKEKRPCIILTDNAKIEVLGTSFNVWSRDNQTRVIVKEGIVRLSPLKSENNFVLIQADQMSQVVADASPLDSKPVQADRLIGWFEGKLIFEHCPFNEFVAEIERQYNTEIQIQSDNLKDLKLSGTFDNLTIEQVLSSVCLTFNLKCDPVGQDTYVIIQK